MKKARPYPLRKIATSEIAERAPVWRKGRTQLSPHSQRGATGDLKRAAVEPHNLFLRGVAEDALRLAKAFAAKHNLTLSQVFNKAARHLPEIERQHEKQLADQQKWLDEVMEMNKKSGLPELPKGTVVKWIREYRDE